MERIRILYFTDIFCVWAYIAQMRLNELEATFQDKVAVDHHFISVFGNAREKLETRWRDQGGLAGYRDHVHNVAKTFNHVKVHPHIWTKVTPASSMSCHLFLHAVRLLETKKIIPRSEKLFEKMAWEFRVNFFSQLADISDRGVQLEIARSLGLPVAAIHAHIDSGEAYAQLCRDFDLVKDHAVTVSPTMIFNEGRQRLNGNVGYRVIEANIRELLQNRPDQHSWC
jgi:predicted DsbA family dithiol-disulfide isomerase